jgi:N-acetyl-alpha-D-muramate 1-phosphate uridylyltransferase
MNINAFIPAAGLGTRLAPLTAHKPKALVEIGDKKLLELVFIKLYSSGIRNFVINVHHFAEQMYSFINILQQRYKDAYIYISDESDCLLDTGGAIKKVRDCYKNELMDKNYPLLVYNVDIISNIDIKKMYEYHLNANNLVSLAVKDRQSNRNFIFNDKNELIGWENKQENAQILVETYQNNAETYQNESKNDYKKAAFSGIHILNPNIFDYTPNEDIFSVKNWYLDLAKKHQLVAYYHNNDNWLDVGRLKDLEILQSTIR